MLQLTSRRFFRELDEAPGGNNLQYILKCPCIPFFDNQGLHNEFVLGGNRGRSRVIYKESPYSTATITKILKFIEIIINTSFHTNQELESQSTIPIPYDAHTAMSSLSIEPQIIRNICCPKCFHHYLLNSLSETCSWRESPWSKRYGEKLWTRRSTRSDPKVIPHQCYNLEE